MALVSNPFDLAHRRRMIELEISEERLMVVVVNGSVVNNYCCIMCN